MKRIKTFFKLIVLLTILLNMNIVVPVFMFAQDDPRTEVIVMFEKGVVSLPEGQTKAPIAEVQISSSQIKEILLQHNVQVISKAFPNFTLDDTLGVSRTGEQVILADLSNIFLLKVADSSKVQDVINAISNTRGVIYAEPNFVDIHSYGFPNDPHYENGDQWGLNNPNDADIDAPEAWGITTGSNVLIGVIDNGVDSGHEDLENKVSGDAGVYGGDQNWPFGHGTHVSGIAAAIGNNDKGIAGVNWAGTINSQRIENGSATHIYNSIMDALNAGSEILNNSWGGPSFNNTIRSAFSNAYNLNVVSIAAMGNDNNSNPSYPAAYGQGIIAVGATDEIDNRSIWPNGKGSNFGNHIDVVAPGTNIWSSLPYTNQYDSWDGTSMATPFVSGIASLLLSKNPSLYNDDIEQIIRSSADDKGVSGWDQYYGTGRVNVYNALRLILCPNQLVRLGPYTGGTVVSTETFNAHSIDVPGLPNGFYNFVRYEVVRDIQFPSFMFAPSVQGLTFSGPIAWGNSNATPQSQTGLPRFTGSSTVSCNSSQYNYGGLPYTEVVPGTITKAGCRLRTYVYSVKTTYYITQGVCVPWDNLGYFPTTPSNVKFYATVLGIPKSIPCAVEKQNLSITQTSTDYVLEQNYPNPFNPNTEISYSIKDAGQVTLRIHDMLGREVATLVNEVEEPGFYKVKFDAGELSSGVYFYSLKSGNFYQIKKMIVVK